MDLVVIIVSMVTVLEAKSVVKLLSKYEQRVLIAAARRKCTAEQKVIPIPVKATFCHMTWDGILCWPYTAAGQLAKQFCPNYINNFDTDAYATRQCQSDGTWYIKPEINSSWTNFSQCSVNDTESHMPEIPELIQEHMPSIVLMKNIGYCISLVTLFIAVFLMLFFKKLHCQRNRIHLNLFASFILRCVIILLRKNVLSEGGAFLPKDVMYDEYNRLRLTPGMHWECKLLQTSFHFVIAANYTWIFLEGLYLHMLIFVSYFTEKNKLKWYMLFGWGFPLLSVIPWVIVRIYFEDENCWQTNVNKGFFWILRGPIVASIIANFVFFLNIVRVLVLKLRASNNQESKKFRYKRLAKSTLVLIPLFGVHYMVFVAKPDVVEAEAELILLYTELFLNSTQGFMVTLLFCFLNGEVQTEIVKMWRRRAFTRGGSFRSRTWTSLSTHWNRHRTSEAERSRVKPRRCFLFRSRGSDSAFSRRRSGIESQEMSSAADRCLPLPGESVQMRVIKEVCDDVSKSSSKEDSGQSDHNENFSNFAVIENRTDQAQQDDINRSVSR